MLRDDDDYEMEGPPSRQEEQERTPGIMAGQYHPEHGLVVYQSLGEGERRHGCAGFPHADDAQGLSPRRERNGIPHRRRQAAACRTEQHEHGADRQGRQRAGVIRRQGVHGKSEAYKRLIFMGMAQAGISNNQTANGLVISQPPTLVTETKWKSIVTKGRLKL